MPYLFAIIGILVVANFYLLFRRNKKGRNVGRKAVSERVASIKRHDDLVRKLDLEQEEASRRVELRNKTFEMYDQVRKNAESAEGQADEDNKG